MSNFNKIINSKTKWKMRGLFFIIYLIAVGFTQNEYIIISGFFNFIALVIYEWSGTLCALYVKEKKIFEKVVLLEFLIGLFGGFVIGIISTFIFNIYYKYQMKKIKRKRLKK